jgi:transposase
VAEDELFTKEDVSRIVSERLKRDREKRGDATLIAENADLKAQIVTLKGEVEDLRAANKRSETTALRARIAKDTHLPEGLASRLQGEDEEAIRADAAKLLEELGPAKNVGQGSNPPQTTPKTWTRAEVEAMTPDQLVDHMPQIEKQLAEGTLR